MMRASSTMRRERFDKMNVVPFIDIVLVLLVIVLATATFVQNKSIKIDLPSASSKKSERKQSIVVSIDKEGKYFYNKKYLSFDALKVKLKALNPKKDIVSLYTDKLTPFDYFVKVVDVMKAKGFENIAIVTKQ
ncbi:MAG: biopolymer transporter ExbD [Sulfurovum sp.]|nr:biopolymer transporter ExbD [Sulfurovum sp.]MCB4746276.1 biopolymer transporter ExbD [Sulfurovum sp.]MCB4774520.1 biopolymer transporter ExbD [Sulfurovum sp.]MCB4775254.1 biopolymer transporter ExbD [Sulfurovum sp.]MCB4777586.1 biopolymer transporter ExbD [Sulfurovum sp.]